ncbi:alpha/beta hydrolase [Streptomyces durmitorensis]|uniref:Alpha/beta hydrolase n=1 Tax=Streptomyces durmitorensis TaxID=319947 RepID=A0ABY4PYT2_9ACTN|nr:alpha/beta hydrolase [Streptomyces durmitorensis]UQT58137.1 alpha/beta hydrolase [Streptomyces durmitorensis]
MRRTLPVLALCVALLSSSAAVEAAPEPSPGKTFSYGGHARQNITVYGDRSARPALMILHGGSWVRDTDWSARARWFAARGFTVYDTDYRLATDAAWPAQRDDVLAALRWVKRRGGSAPLVLGSSAGGHLAVSAGAYGAGRKRVRGVVALSPVASPYRAWKDGGMPAASSPQRKLRGTAELLAGCVPDRAAGRCWKKWVDLVAKSHASGKDDAPLFLTHSAADFVPVAHSTDLAHAQTVAGLRDATVRIEQGTAHGGELLRNPGFAQAVLRWLRQHA